MINWIKDVLGIAAPKAEPMPMTPPAKKPVSKRTPTKKPASKGTAKKQAAKKAATELKAKKQTKATLAKLTKTQIDELAKAELGADLDRRKTKDAMIKDYLTAQKK